MQLKLIMAKSKNGRYFIGTNNSKIIKDKEICYLFNMGLKEYQDKLKEFGAYKKDEETFFRFKRKMKKAHEYFEPIFLCNLLSGLYSEFDPNLKNDLYEIIF